jgi:hypothetical protein
MSGDIYPVIIITDPAQANRRRSGFSRCSCNNTTKASLEVNTLVEAIAVVRLYVIISFGIGDLFESSLGSPGRRRKYRHGDIRLKWR